MKFTSIFAILIAALLLMPTSASASIVIDNYTAGNTLQQTMAGTVSQITTDGSILGGVRAGRLTVTSQGGNEFFGIVGFSGALDVGQGSQDQINGQVTYNSFGILDMTEGGLNDQFELRFLSSDINSPLANIVSVTATSNGISATNFVTVPANSGLPATVFSSFASFAGVDFTTIDSVELAFDFAGSPGRDFEIGLFAASNSVPEPTSGLLLGLGMIGLVYRRRK